MRKPLIRYVLALLLFGSNGIVATHIFLPSAQIVLCRTFLGSSLLALILLLQAHHNDTEFASPAHLKEALFLLLGGAGLGGGWIFLFQAYTLVGVGIASLVYYIGPVLVMSVSPLLFHSHLGAKKLLGFAAVVAGTLLVMGQNASGSLNSFGLARSFMSAIMYATMVIADKKVTHIKGLENAAIQLFGAFFTALLYALITGQAAPQLELNDIAPILILGLVNTGLGCYLYFSAMNALSIQTVSVCGYLEPLSAVVLSVIALHEPMSLLQAFGAVLILSGAAFPELSDHLSGHKIHHRRFSARAQTVLKAGNTQALPRAHIAQ